MLLEAGPLDDALFEMAPDALVVVDGHGVILRVNRQIETLLGWTPAELLGRAIEVLVPDDVAAAHASWRAEYARNPRLRAMGAAPRRARRKDGGEVPVDVMLGPIGRNGAVICAIRDMTRLDQATRRLLRLDRTLRAVTNCNQALVHATDESALLQQVCQVVIDAGGYRLAWVGLAEDDELKSVRVAAHAGDDRGYLGQLALTHADSLRGRGPTGTAIRSGRIQLLRNIATDPAFAPWREEALRRGYASSIALPITIEGQVAGALNLYCDAPDALDAEEVQLLAELTEDLGYGLSALRTRALVAAQQAALRSSEERYRSLFERNLAGVYRSTLDGRIVECNEAFVRMFGYGSREEVLAVPAERLYEASRARVEFLARLKAEGRVLNHESAGRRKDGTGITFLEAACLLEGPFIEGTVLDVTERRALEERLRQAQKMEAIGRLAGGVAHDFNNLLGVIMGYAEAVQRQLAADGPLHAKLEQILKAVRRAADFTRQLLAFSRQQILQNEVLNLNTVVSDMEEMLRRLIGEDVELQTALDPQLGNVSADKGQLQQILMNLVVNARDAMPEGGRVTIETRNAEIGDDYFARHPQGTPPRPGRYIELIVSDTGAGMDRETLARIFEPFFTTKELGRGTGLGLSTVYGIVKQSDGLIWVYSEVGVGTTFRTLLPRADAAESELPQPAPTAAPLERARGETVLLVEDETALRDLLLERLEENGYTVMAARDGVEAVQLAEAHPGPIDVMVSDFIMPGMTGRGAADVITAARPQMKVLFISGYSAETARRRGLPGHGAAAFLGKPFTPDCLLRKLQDLLHT